MKSMLKMFAIGLAAALVFNKVIEPRLNKGV